MHCKEINNSLKPQGELAPMDFAVKNTFEKKKKKPTVPLLYIEPT